MPNLMKDIFFLVINTVLLAVIALGVINNQRLVKSEVNSHVVRNEAANLCQIETVYHPPFPSYEAAVQFYKECIDRRSGEISPIDLGQKK